MKVHIEGNLYLESDNMQFILKEYTGAISVDKKTGKETEVCNNVGYYTNIHSALKALMVMKIKDTTATNLSELSADIKRIENWIRSRFEVELKDGERVAI
jgi:hypothetical protein